MSHQPTTYIASVKLEWTVLLVSRVLRQGRCTCNQLLLLTPVTCTDNALDKERPREKAEAVTWEWRGKRIRRTKRLLTALSAA